MTNNELEALRRLLFFSVPEAAALVGGVGEQAWRRWEAGSRGVPADVAQRMADLAGWRRSAIGAAVKQMGTATPDSRLALVWYSTLDDWSTLPDREPAFWRPQQSVCATLVAEFPSRLRLVAFDAPAYAAWLAGRADSEVMRGQWAAA